MRLTTIIPRITILMWSIVQQRERVYAWLKAMRDSWDNYALRAVETIMLWERRDHTGVLGTSSHQSNCLELLHFLAAAPSLSSIWPGYNNAIRRHTRHSADAAETAMGTSSLPTVLYCTVLYCTVLYCTALQCTVLYCTVLYTIAHYNAKLPLSLSKLRLSLIMDDICHDTH